MKRDGMMRAVKCAALLLLLGASGYLGARREEGVRMVSVPIAYETLDAAVFSDGSLAETGKRLLHQRQEAIRLLDSVIENPAADEGSVRGALEEKARMAKRAETEALIEEALLRIGVESAVALQGEALLAVFAPQQAAMDERLRTQMIDLASSFSGLPAKSVKIILTKK